MQEQQPVVTIDAAAARRRLRGSLEQAGVELPPATSIREVVLTFAEGLMRSEFDGEFLPSQPIPEGLAFLYWLTRQGLTSEQMRPILSHYASAFPESRENKIYPTVIA